jgi:hypothetical protein
LEALAMSENTFIDNFDGRLHSGILSLSEAVHLAEVLKSKYGRYAIVPAFEGEALALEENRLDAIVFWVHVQDYLNPYSVKLTH